MPCYIDAYIATSTCVQFYKQEVYYLKWKKRHKTKENSFSKLTCFTLF